MLRTNLEEHRSFLESSLVRALGVLFVALSLATVVGCGNRNGAGEQIDEAVEEVGDEVDDAVDD